MTISLNDEILKQINALLANPSNEAVDTKAITDRISALEAKTPPDLKPLSDRITKLEARPSVDLTPVDEAIADIRLVNVRQGTSITSLITDVSNLSTNVDSRIKALDKVATDKNKQQDEAIAALTTQVQAIPAPLSVEDIAKQLDIESIYAPDEVSPDLHPHWRTWLQDGIKDNKEYDAFYIRSIRRDGAVKIWETVGAIVETKDQTNSFSYTGISGITLRYNKTRDPADQSYSFWFITQQGTLENNAVRWIGYDAAGVEVDRGSMGVGDGSETKIFPRTQTKFISLQLYWSDPNRAPELYTIGVS